MKKLLALLLAVAMLLSFAACGEKEPEPETTTTTNEATTAAGEPVDATTAAIEESSAPVEESSADAAEETTAEESTKAAIETAPTAKADIIALYNSAVNSAFDAKAGFNKSRSTDNEKLNAGAVLKAFKSLVYQFMGIGAENKYTQSVTKGNWDAETKRHYLRKSTLTEGDVTSATCKATGDDYTIVLNVKGGSSKGSKDKKFTNAPIDKCGICVGNEDKGYYDHKTGEVIYDAISGAYAGATIDEKYSNAKITAVVDGATGNLVKLTVEFDIDVAIDIGIGSGTATATTHIIYTDFKY